MNQKFHAPKGVAEYVPPDSAGFLAVKSALSRSAELAGYSYVELPIFEDTNLYVRGVGESTDVVSKEMYTFDDRGEGHFRCARREQQVWSGQWLSTTSTVRDCPSSSGTPDRSSAPSGHNRPVSAVQSGGVEALGSEDPALDAEVIAIAAEGFQRPGLKGFRLLLNSLGDTATRVHYREILTSFLANLDLDPETTKRAQLNPLRVLDDKRPQVQAMLVDAPLMRDVLSDSAREHHEAVCTYLRELKVDFSDAPRLVRGLDYYTRTTFEFVHDGLGAQSAIGGGGRYDGLMSDLGGQELSGIGYGLGSTARYWRVRPKGLRSPRGSGVRCSSCHSGNRRSCGSSALLRSFVTTVSASI